MTSTATATLPDMFAIDGDWDVTEAHGAPDAHTYGQAHAAATLAACMGSRVSYTEVEGRRWRMERQSDGARRVWIAVDVTALAAFTL